MAHSVASSPFAKAKSDKWNQYFIGPTLRFEIWNVFVRMEHHAAQVALAVPFQRLTGSSLRRSDKFHGDLTRAILTAGSAARAGRSSVRRHSRSENYEPVFHVLILTDKERR